MKNKKRNQIIQSEADLYQHLKEQIQFLIKSCSEYDSGRLHEAKRISVIIRILLHDTKKSTSLLKNLNKKNILFVDTATNIIPNNMLSHNGLISMKIINGIMDYIPRLGMHISFNKISFDDWWDKLILKSTNNKRLNRRGIVLNLSDTDGGAHIDTKLKNDYAEFSRGNALGWVNLINGVEYKPNTDPILASVRQIGYELLLTLEEEFPFLFGLDNLNLELSQQTINFISNYKSKISKPIVYRDISGHYSPRLKEEIIASNSEIDKHIVWVDCSSRSLDYPICSCMITFFLDENNFPTTARPKKEQSNYQLEYIGAFMKRLVYEDFKRVVLKNNGITNKQKRVKLSFDYAKLKDFKEKGRIQNYSLDFCDLCLNYLSVMRSSNNSIITKLLFRWRIGRIDKNIISVGKSLVRIIRKIDDSTPESVFSILVKLRDTLHLQGKLFVKNAKGMFS